MDELKITPIWSDSMGAKTMSVRIDTDETSILIDPGAAVMQRGYPLDVNRKYELSNKARCEIEKSSVDVQHVVVTHYHYDHHFLPDTGGIDFYKVFDDYRSIWIKNPNEWINPSQWKRSRQFIKALMKDKLDGEEFLRDIEYDAPKKEYEDPLNNLPLLKEIDEGEYSKRREELHKKWRNKFLRRVEMWRSEKHIKEPLDHVKFAEGRSFKKGKTKVRFTTPLFHGIEYSNMGWVFGVVIERNSEKFIYSSDLHGPTIEDYAKWIIDENPDFLILDGPATYHLGYLLNKFNLDRSIKNASRIVKKCDFEIMLYDHHLTRGKLFRDRTELVWKTAKDLDKEVLTYREFHEGKRPLIEEITE